MVWEAVRHRDIRPEEPNMQASLVRELWHVVQYFLAASLSLPLHLGSLRSRV